MPESPDRIDVDEVQRLIDEGIRLGPDGLAARVAQLEAADDAARARGETVTVTLEAPDPLTGEIVRVQGRSMAEAQARLDALTEDSPTEDPLPHPQP